MLYDYIKSRYEKMAAKKLSWKAFNLMSNKRQTNADLKISLYSRVRIKIIP